jgi:hypothetical protein
MAQRNTTWLTVVVSVCFRNTAISQNTHYYGQVYGHNNKNSFPIPIQRSVFGLMDRTRDAGPRMTDKRVLGGGGVEGGRDRPEKDSNYTFVCTPDWNFNTHIWEDYDPVYQYEYKPINPVGKSSKKCIEGITALFAVTRIDVEQMPWN